MSETQTTAERIAGLFYVALDLGSAEWISTIQTAEVVAAEIDALTERNAFLLTSAETAQAQLAEARAEIERLRLPAEAWEAYDDYRQTCVASCEIQSVGVRWPSFAEVSEKLHKAKAAAARAREARK